MLAGKSAGDQIHDILNGTDEGNFGWLRWPYDPSGGTEEVLLEALSSGDTSEFENAADPDDTNLSVGDWIWANIALSNSVAARETLDGLIDTGPIRVVVFDEHSDQAGANGKFHTSAFAIVRLTDYSLPGTNKISIEFEGFDSTGCVE